MGNSPAPLQAMSCAVVAGFQQLLEMGVSMKQAYAGTSGWAYTTWQPVFYQLPPNLKCDLPMLTDFLAGLPHHVRFAFEFRHDSWFRDDVFASLHGTKMALCLAESEN